MTLIKSRRASMLVVACAVVLACVIVPAAVFAVIDAGGGVGVAALADVKATSTPAQAISGAWVAGDVTVTIEATAVSPATAEAAYSFSGDPGSFLFAGAETTQVPITSEGITTLVVGRRVSGDSEPSDLTTYTIKIDKNRPEVPTLKPVASGWTTSSVTVTASATDAGPSGIKDYGWTVTRNNTAQTPTYTVGALTFSADGTYSVDVVARDNALNMSASPTTTAFKVDSNAPTTSVNSLADVTKWQSKATTLSLNSVDPAGGSGWSNTWTILTMPTGETSLVTPYTPGNILNITAEGTSTLKYWAKDIAGNVEATKTALVRLDLTKPKTTSDATTTYNGLARISLVASDAVSGIDKTYYSVDGQAAKVGLSVVVTSSATPNHTLSFWSVDKAGNIETTNTATFAISADTAPPSTSATGSAGVDLAKWQSRDVTVTLVATDTPSGSGVVATYYRVGGSAVTTYLAPFNVSAEGTTAVDFWSVDDVGNKEATRTAVISIDRTKPGSSLITTAVAFDETAYLSVLATDKPSGIRKVVSWVDTAPATIVVDNQSGIATQTVPILCSVAGTHTVSYVVSDMAGNSETTKSVTVHVTRTPKVTLTTKSATLKNTGSPTKATVAGTLTDGTTGMAGRPVTLLYSTSSTFTTVKSLAATTTAGGKFSFSVSLADKTYYAVRFDGDADYYQAQSAKISLLPRAYISTPKAGTSQHSYVTFYVTGTVKPAHSKSSYLYVKRYKYSSTKHAYVYNSKVRATITAKTGYSNYKSGQKLSKGTWRFYAYMAADSKHASTTSSYLKVTIR